jgi:hypothetical protein
LFAFTRLDSGESQKQRPKRYYLSPQISWMLGNNVGNFERMKTGFPKLPDDQSALSLFEWLYQVKAGELGLNTENNTATEVKEFSSFWFRDIAPKLREVIGCLYHQSNSPLISMYEILHIWAACNLDRVAQCKRSRCGRFFLSGKSATKYCHSKCRQQDIAEQYDTDAYREKKRLAMRTSRESLKKLREAKSNAKRRQRLTRSSRTK